MSQSETVAVILPCFNEAQTIAKVIKSFKIYLPKALIYVYDNGSTDDTVARAHEAGALIRRVPLRGKGQVIKRAIADIEADYYIMVDGDDTYDIAQSPALLAHLQMNHLDMVTGARVAISKHSHRFGHTLGNWFFNMTISQLFNCRFRDIFSGYRVFTRRFAKSFPCTSCGFEIETEMSLHALSLQLPMDELSSDYRARPLGSHSKLNTIRDGLRILKAIITLLKDFKPLSLFSLLGVSQLGLATYLFRPILIQYFDTGLVPRLPTWILIASICLFSVMLFSLGIVLDSIKTLRLENRKLNYLAIPNQTPGS